MPSIFSSADTTYEPAWALTLYTYTYLSPEISSVFELFHVPRLMLCAVFTANGISTVSMPSAPAIASSTMYLPVSTLLPKPAISTFFPVFSLYLYHVLVISSLSSLSPTLASFTLPSSYTNWRVSLSRRFLIPDNFISGRNS